MATTSLCGLGLRPRGLARSRLADHHGVGALQLVGIHADLPPPVVPAQPVRRGAALEGQQHEGIGGELREVEGQGVHGAGPPHGEG